MDKNPADYKKFFTADCEITCLHCDFLMRRSPLAQADLLALDKGLTFHVFLRKDKEIRCAEEGHAIFFDQARYEKLLSDFKKYVEKARTEFIPRYSTIPTDISKEEFLAAANFLGEFWYYYGFTEFPFIDYALSEAQRLGDTAVLSRLDEFSKFKFIGREILNAYWFEGGPLPNILLALSRMFLTADDAKFLFLDELTALFDSWKPKPSLISERRAYYGVSVTDATVQIFDATSTEQLYTLFTAVPNGTVLHGVTANRGKAQGRVVIAPMLNDRSAIAALDQKMHKGDILVAETTGPDFMALCRKAAAIVADQGGMLSHAAVVSRELGIPCIVQTGTATRQIKEGDMVEVDADMGIVKILDRS